MTWLAWRQYRLELAAALAIVAALAAYLVPTGLSKFASFEDSGLKACLAAGATDCSDLRWPFVASYDSVINIVGWFNFVPGVVGLLLAAPVVNEFDRRTYRLAWTQSVTRWHWLLAKTGLALVGVTFFAVALTILMTWWHQPLDLAEPRYGRNFSPSFNFAAAMPFAHTLWALSLALAAGVLTRRMIVTVPAALLLFIATRVPLEFVLRPAGVMSFEGPAGQIRAEGEPSLFWQAQAVEASILIGASAALIGLTVWVVSRRMR
jgi:hypothetical protein